eukprot:2076773-Pyramimonas_sp.AAC.1
MFAEDLLPPGCVQLLRSAFGWPAKRNDPCDANARFTRHLSIPSFRLQSRRLRRIGRMGAMPSGVTDKGDAERCDALGRQQLGCTLLCFGCFFFAAPDVSPAAGWALRTLWACRTADVEERLPCAETAMLQERQLQQGTGRREGRARESATGAPQEMSSSLHTLRAQRDEYQRQMAEHVRIGPDLSGVSGVLCGRCVRTHRPSGKTS